MRVLAFATIAAVLMTAPVSAQDCMSKSQARRIYGDAHIYYQRDDDRQKCWYAKGTRTRDTSYFNGSPFRGLMEVFMPPPPVVDDDEEEPRPKAKRTKAKPKKVAKRRYRTRTVASTKSNEEIKRILCGDSCPPSFRNLGNLRELNERRAKELGVQK